MERVSILLPAEFAHNRPIVMTTAANGETLRFLADTGGGCVMTKEAVARAGFPSIASIEGEARIERVRSPSFREDGCLPPLLLQGEPGFFLVLEGKRGPLDDLDVDGILGQAWFADRVWTIDYLNGSFVYHAAGVDLPASSGPVVPLGFRQDGEGRRANSFPRIQASIDGETVDFLFDTGATASLTERALAELGDSGTEGGSRRGTCFITHSLFMRWKRRNPHWRVIEQAERGTGCPMIEVPEIEIAGYAVGPVTFMYRPDHNFHQYISGFTDRKVEGAIGGSALQYFRITADYPRAAAYFAR